MAHFRDKIAGLIPRQKLPHLSRSRTDFPDAGGSQDPGSTGLEEGIAHCGTLYRAADYRDAGGVGDLLHQVGIAGTATYHVENIYRVVTEIPQG